MSRKTRNRKVSALVSAILFASSSYCSAAKIIADDIDNEWATYMNELTLKCIENENNCKLNYVFNSNSKYNRNTINRIESQLTKIIFDSALSDEKITPKEAVSKVVSIEDGETSFDSCLYSFIIDNSNYYFDLKTISVSNEDYITTVTINLDELVLIKDQIQKDDFSYFISMMDKTNSEETGKLRIDGVFEKENKLYVHKINSGYNISFDMNFGWICDLQDYELKVSSNQISVDMEMIKKHISLFQNSITFTDSKDNKNILINRKNNYSPKFSEIRKKCEVSTTNSNLWIKEVLINGNAVYIADNEFKSSIDISPFINSGTIKVSKDYNNSITVITYEKIITVPVYCIEDGREQLYKNEQFEIKLDNSDLYIDVDKYIFNNTGIVDSYLSKLIYQDYINNEIEENIDTSHTENKKRIYLKKDLSRLYYSKLSYINDNNNEDLFNQLTSFSFQKKTNEFYVNRSIDIKTIEKNNEENDFFKNNSLLINYYESSYSQSNNNTRINRTIIDIIPSREDLTIIRGFINKNDNNRLTNSLESPIYICHDIHPPIISNIPESTPWTNSTQTLTFTAKDFVLEYPDPYTNETMKFSSDITSFKLGAATVNRTDNGWAVTQGEDTVYTVDSFTQNGDEYTVEFSTPENTSHFETIAINATDEYGNTSKDIPYTLRFDKQNPEVTTISGGNEIRDIDSQMSVFISDTNSDSIIIKAIPNDIYDDAAELSSGISGGVLTFSDSKEKYNANLDNGVLVFKVPNTARAEKFTITVTDNAKNEDTFSFNTGENHVSKSDSALFVVDKCAPEITSAISKPDNCIETTLNGNQTWYNSYPALSFKVKDHLSEKCKDKSCKETVSGLNTITITYIGKDGKNYDLKTDAKGVSLFSGMLYICDNDEDPNAVDITLIGNDESDEPIITVPKNKSGKFEFVIKSSDRSDRVNEEAAPVFYVDNKHPYAEDILSVKSKNSKEFGTFSNEDIIIEAVIHDDDPSSGMKSATLKVGTKSFPGKFIGNNKWQFKIASEFAPVSGDISIIMLDNAGNEHETKTVRNPEGSNFLMIENTKPEVFPKPVITAVSGNNTPYISKNKNNDECKWYSGDVDLEFWWKDSDSGMDISSVRIENKEKKTVTYSDDFTFSNKAGSKWINRFDTSYIKIRTPENEDGKITFFFEGTDNCGNKAETKETVYKDITAPKITSVTTANDDIPNLLPFRELNTGNSADNLQRYDYFSNKQIKLTIKAEDLNASSGLDYIRYKIYNHDGTLINSDTKKFTNDTITIDKISENFKGYITAQAFDNVGNSSQTACVYGMISENEECHLENSSIRINLPDSEYTDEKGNMLYSHDINVNISAEDTYSGINKISWRISNDSEGYFEENEIGYNNILNGKEIFGEWLVYGYEKNLATKLTSGISEQNNANGLKMDVSFTDNTGHSLSKSVTYSIDKDKPELTAAFLPSHYDEQYTNIFNAPRTAVINIKERNFNPDDTYIDAPGANIGSFSLVSGKEGTKEACYEAKVTFENDGEYKYSAISYDKCKNESNRYESETFIIDRTAPKISVDFGDTASNGKYFNSSRTAVITVVEQNFDENRIKVSATLNGKTDKLPKLSSWTHNGNVHTAQMVFTEAGEYTFSVSGSDKASNAAEEIYTTEFTIDKTLPNITFRGLKDKSANRGSSAFSVRITDKYLDLDSVNVRIDGAKRGENIKINSKKKNLKNGVEFTFDNLPKEQKYDDVYHVTATAKDKAGNPIEKTLDFSVNRFGSTYIFDEATQKISRKYVKEPVDVVIHEINPDKLDPEKTLVVFAKDGISHIMNENEGFTLDVTGGNGKWYDYQYTLGVENFREDGAYYIMMYSQDVAGNANTNQEESQNAELRFGIDSTPPHLASVDLQTNGSYRAKDYYTARIRTVDLMFKELHVYLNDSETEEQTTFVDEYTYTFEVPAMEAPQKIRVVGYDYAGNRSEIEVTNVLVNPSIFKVLMRKSWFHLILAGIAGLIGWGLSKFIKRQKAIHDMAVKLQLK